MPCYEFDLGDGRAAEPGRLTANTPERLTPEWRLEIWQAFKHSSEGKSLERDGVRMLIREIEAAELDAPRSRAEDVADALVDSAREIDALRADVERLTAIAKDFHWMARRYADGRSTYATSMFNEHTRALLAMAVELNPTADGTIWARDRMCRAYDGLTDDEAAVGQPFDQPPAYARQDEIAELRSRVEAAEAALARSRALSARWKAEAAKGRKGETGLLTAVCRSQESINELLTRAEAAERERDDARRWAVRLEQDLAWSRTWRDRWRATALRHRNGERAVLVASARLRARVRDALVATPPPADAPTVDPLVSIRRQLQALPSDADGFRWMLTRVKELGRATLVIEGDESPTADAPTPWPPRHDYALTYDETVQRFGRVADDVAGEG